MPDASTKRRLTAAEQQEAMESLSQQAASVLIGKPVYYLRDHSNWIPRNADKSYSGPALVAAFLDRETAAEPESPSDVSLERRRREAEVRKFEEQASKAEFENELARGEWVRIDIVVSLISGILASYSERLMALSQRVAPEMSEEVAAVVCPKIDAQARRLLVGLQEEMQRAVPSGGEQ